MSVSVLRRRSRATTVKTCKVLLNCVLAATLCGMPTVGALPVLDDVMLPVLDVLSLVSDALSVLSITDDDTLPLLGEEVSLLCDSLWSAPDVLSVASDALLAVSFGLATWLTWELGGLMGILLI
jgi:hypothetical protein